MSLDPDLHHRKSIRLRARDYSSPGHYYVTLCTEERKSLFGDIIEGVMHLNDMGRAVETCWRDIPRHFPHAELDEFVIMPNHVHGIIRIVTREWVHVDSPLRAIGIPIMPALVVTGTNVLDVGANDHSPLHVPNVINRVRQINPNHPRGTSRTIGSMIRGFKIGVTRWAIQNGFPGHVWQRNYHDHIIRHERSLERVRAYIRANPENWMRDRNNPDRCR
jgi:putative transposase